MFDSMIFILTLIKTIRNRRNYPVAMNELTDIIFRDGKPLLGHTVLKGAYLLLR